MEDRCICCGEIIPEGRQVCWTCEKGEKYDKERFWDSRPCFNTGHVEKRHGVYRGEYYQVLVERTSEDARTYKTVKEYRKMKVLGVYPNIITLKDKSGIVESFRWNDFYKKRK